MHGFDLNFRAAPSCTCRVRVGVGALDRLVEDLAAEPLGSRLFVVADERVAELYGSALSARLVQRGLRADLLTFPEGERSKSRETKAILEDRLVALGAGRDAALVAVGGGVTGDLAGFLAATWHRGVPVVQVPTTLLAMVDAALGGKTAVNLPAGKNLIGAFHQPRGIYADPAVLQSLEEQIYLEGLAEMIKAGVVADVRSFRWLEANVDAVRGRHAQALADGITRCLHIKGRIVRGDEREAGRRAALNFGHTIGHAVESASGYRVRHGAAVAIGMAVEGRLATTVTGFPEVHRRRLERLIAAAGLSRAIPANLRAAELIAATLRDKKARDGRARYALPVALGRMPVGPTTTSVVADDAVLAVLESPDSPN